MPRRRSTFGERGVPPSLASRQAERRGVRRDAGSARDACAPGDRAISRPRRGGRDAVERRSAPGFTLLVGGIERGEADLRRPSIRCNAPHGEMRDDRVGVGDEREDGRRGVGFAKAAQRGDGGGADAGIGVAQGRQ